MGPRSPRARHSHLARFQNIELLPGKYKDPFTPVESYLYGLRLLHVGARGNVFLPSTAGPGSFSPLILVEEGDEATGNDAGPDQGIRGLRPRASLASPSVLPSGQGPSGPSPEPTAETTPSLAHVGGPLPKCWLCQDLGGIAVHRGATKAFGSLMFTPHEVPSGSHETAHCPACEAQTLREILDNGVGNVLGRWMLNEASNVPTGFVAPTKGASP